MRTKECFYKGHRTLIEFDSEDQVYYGKIEGIQDLFSFEGESMELAEKEFEKSVDDYLITKAKLK